MKKGGKKSGAIKLPAKVKPLPGTAGVKQRQTTSRAQRVAKMEKADTAV